MPTFIVRGSWTDHGIRAVKEAPKRIRAARDLAKKMGIDFKQICLTSGESDLLVILDGEPTPCHNERKARTSVPIKS